MPSVLMWERPRRVMSKEQHQSISADGAPPGVYIPNMSRADRLRWKAKLTGTRRKKPQIELRRNGMVIVVAGSKGYKYKARDRGPKFAHHMHITSNDAQVFDMAGWTTLVHAVEEARQVLRLIEDTDPEVGKRAQAAIKAGHSPLAVP